MVVVEETREATETKEPEVSEVSVLAGRALAYLEERGWVQWVPSEPNGVCLGKAVIDVTGCEQNAVLRHPLWLAIKKRVGPRLVGWNDNPWRTFEDVKAVLLDIRDNG